MFFYLHALPRSENNLRRRAATLLRQYRGFRKEADRYINGLFNCNPQADELASRYMRRALRCQGEYIMFRNMIP